MPERLFILEIISQIEAAIEKVVVRFATVKTVDDFTHSPSGMEKLDAVCMQIIVIGELLKKLDKVTHGALLQKYSQVEWKKAMAMRDIITHHYTSSVDAEVVYNTCKNKIPSLQEGIRQLKKAFLTA
ncbi:MAG: DUF86 domain-containing protein [Prevotellaceae bacterium]|jgi:uncharacterized protein with HEPN domain|nr:DUF86 domain-containing protein [Prevotellaceae bacterium]